MASQQHGYSLDMGKRVVAKYLLTSVTLFTYD